MNKKYDILLISSISPDKSSYLGKDIMLSLQNIGHKVDFLTKYKIEDSTSNIISVFNYLEPIIENQNKTHPIIKRLKERFKFLNHFHRPSFLQPKINRNGYVMVNIEENTPPVDPELIIEKIEKKYDFVIVLFWQYMLNAKSLSYIYKFLKTPILILAADMAPLTGGCYYFKDCRNFLDTCGKCPGLNSRKKLDKTYYNFILKKQIYNEIDLTFLGNSWMCEYAKKSPLLENKNIMHILSPINENIYKPRNKEKLKKEFEIPFNKNFFLFAGASHTTLERKGFKYLVEAVNLFYQQLKEEEKFQVILLLAGNLPENTKNLFQIDIKELGFIDTETLAKTYALADVFLCPSIDDAGPTMINQSIMTGTPVVSFEMGVAFDIVIPYKTGYRAKLKDSQDFSKGINYIYNLNPLEKSTIEKNCRNLGVEKFSLPVFAENIQKILDKLNVSSL